MIPSIFPSHARFSREPPSEYPNVNARHAFRGSDASDPARVVAGGVRRRRTRPSFENTRERFRRRRPRRRRRRT